MLDKIRYTLLFPYWDSFWEVLHIIRNKNKKKWKINNYTI